MVTDSDLSVRGESVQRLYDYHLANRFLVNRRYQRKLVWTIEEKKSFIDSLRNELPVPLILVAESGETSSHFEIIDGMQRLNAVMAFIEGEFALDEGYFDLQTLAETKLRVDEGELEQKTPVLDRKVCASIASYTVPLSIYRAAVETEVDEIFRRINSAGRHLSRQELRQAGATSNLASIVRSLAAEIRGDVSAKDILPLGAMGQISITSRDLDYGISVDDLFWVREGILTRDQVRDSRDEEIVAELVAAMVLDDMPPSGTAYMDELYGLKESSAGRDATIEASIAARGPEAITREFVFVFDELRKVLAEADKPFNRLMLDSPPPRVPRYFQVIFLAMYKLLVGDDKRIVNYGEVEDAFDGIGDRIVQVGGGGGRWSAGQKQENVNAVVGVISRRFRERDPAEDPAIDSWVSRFESLLTQSFTEQSLYDFKQGIFTLSDTPELDKECLNRICQTLSAIANAGPRSRGYVLLGVADDLQDAERVRQVHDIESTEFRSFYISGIAHEAGIEHSSLDEYIRFISQQIEASDLDPRLTTITLNQMRLVRYFDKAVLVLPIESLEEPTSFGARWFDRRGSSTVEVPPQDVGILFRRYSATT